MAGKEFLGRFGSPQRHEHFRNRQDRRRAGPVPLGGLLIAGEGVGEHSFLFLRHAEQIVDLRQRGLGRRFAFAQFLQQSNRLGIVPLLDVGLG